MNQYGANQDGPYTGQQEGSNLVDNPRYQGQSAGTGPQGTTGPQQESRYGAAPLNTGGTQQGQHHGQHGTGTDQGGYGAPPTTGGYGVQEPGYGSQQTTTGHGLNTNTQPGYGSQTTSGYGSNPNPQSGYGSQSTTGGYGQPGLVDPNARPNQAGYGSQPTGGYGTHQQGETDFARDQPGYGQPGFGAPSEGQHTGSLWPHPATPPNAHHKHDLMGQGQGQQQQQGQGGYGQQQQDQGPYGQQHHQGPSGYDQHQGPYGQQQAGGHDQPPRKEGVMDKVKDAVGVGPRSHGEAPGQQQGYNPNVNHPSETKGFGGGHGHHGQNPQDQMGGGYSTGIATGADAYTQSQPPRREGIVDKAKDAVGVGPNSGYDSRTQTGNDAYVHGNHPVGMQDRVQGVNEPSMLGGERGEHAPVGRRDGGLNQGEHVPDSLIGETRTEPGYDASKGHLPGQGGHHQKLGETGLGGLGGHHNTGTDATGIDGRRGKGFEDGTGPYDSKSTTGTGTGHKTGADTYDGTTGTGTGTGGGYDDTTTGAAPKKGFVTKIKEKLHH